MSNELMRPIDAETAAAIEATAKLGTSVVEAATSAGAFADRVLQRVPDNLVGLLIGDYLAHKRVRRWIKLQEETEKILLARGVKKPFEEISPNLAIPLVEAAIDEDREGLREAWEQLFASAYDPKRKHLVRPSLIVLLKQFDPPDAVVLNFMMPIGGTILHSIRDFSEVINKIALGVNMSDNEVEVSIDHLAQLGCLRVNKERKFYPDTTAIARLLLQAMSEN